MLIKTLSTTKMQPRPNLATSVFALTLDVIFIQLNLFFINMIDWL